MFRSTSGVSNSNFQKMLTLFTFKFAKQRICPSNVYQDGSNTNHFGSVSVSQSHSAAASQCMGDNNNNNNSNNCYYD